MDRLKALLDLPLEDPVLIFSLVLAIILFAPLIFDKLRIPNIVGLIFAGVIFGPHGLGVLEYDSSFQLFGQVGVLYIIFLSGLDVDMNDFRHNRTKSLVFGLFTFLIPMLLGTITGIGLVYVIYSNLAGGNGIIWVTGEAYTTASLLKYCTLSALVLASMYASNTLLAYPIVNRFGVNHHRTVNITVGGTMITTILALVVLAIVLEIIQGEMTSSFWIMFGVKITLFAIAVLYVMPKVSRWFFKTYADNVLQYIFVLAMMFLASFLAKLAGIEYIIGAFIAGISLNRLIPKRSPLMNRIDFVGNAIFIPFFLISVGMIVDFSILFDGFMTILSAVVLSGVATLSKYLAAKATQKTFRMSNDEGMMMFGLSNAQAAATLAAATIAYNLVIGHLPDGTAVKLINEEILNGTVIMILVTCTISSFYTEKASRNLVVAQPHNEEDNEKYYKPELRILLPISNPHTLESLMELAVLINERKEKQPIYSLCVVDEDNQDSSKVLEGRKMLEKSVMLGAASDNKVKMISRYDINIAHGITNVVKEKNISDVIIGLHNKSNLSDSFLGNMADSLLDGVNRSIYIFRSIQPLGTIRRIVVAVPEKAEMESGFNIWCERILTLAKQIDAAIEFRCTALTQVSISQFAQRNKVRVPIRYKEFNHWELFNKLSEHLTVNDLFIVVTARKHSISYQSAFEKLPSQLSTYFQENSFIVLFPEQFKEGEIDRM